MSVVVDKKDCENGMLTMEQKGRGLSVEKNHSESAAQSYKHDKAKSKRKSPVWLDLTYLLIKIGAFGFCALLAMTFLFGAVRINSVSMQPAIQNGDLVFFYRLDKTFSTQDLAVIEYEGDLCVLRVIAVEGDVVDIGENGLSVNGALQYESYIYGSETTQFVGGISFPITLNKGELFLLADLREGATDSRMFGAVNSSDTLGKVMTIIRRRNF